MLHLGKSLRAMFPVFAAFEQKYTQKLIYLDSAASAQKPMMVIDAMTRFLQEDYASVHRGAYRLSAAASERFEAARERVLKFARVSRLQDYAVVYTRNTTEALNFLATSLGEVFIDENSRIVLPISEHHANFVPWQQLALRKNAEIAYIPLQKTPKGFMLDLHAAQKLITPSTRIVTLAHTGNVLGHVQPVAEVAAMAKKVGATVILDCAQSMASFAEDFFALGVDALAFSPHKIYGPTGLGVLVARRTLLESLPPVQFGGAMISKVTPEESDWAEVPQRFEAGTPPVVEVIGLDAAIAWLEDLGRERVHNHAAHLAALLREKLLSLFPEIEVYSSATGEETLVSFRHKRIHAHDLATWLDSFGVCVRAGHHCAWPLVQALGIDALVRASFGAYNDSDDVEALLEALHHAEREFLQK